MEQTLFLNDELNTIFGNSGRKILGSLDAVAGTEKKNHIECSYCKVVSCREKVFAAAYAWIAGTLLIGGSKFHIYTNVPWDPTPDVVRGMREIQKNSNI